MTIELNWWFFVRMIWVILGLIGLFTVIAGWPKVRAEYKRKKKLREMARRAVRDEVFRSVKKHLAEDPPETYKKQNNKPRGPIGS